MRLTTLAAFMLFAGVAQAQTPLTGTTGPLASAPPTRAMRAPRTPAAAPAAAPTPGTEQAAPVAAAPARHTGRTLQERFDEANTTHDGHLTLEQARAKIPSVARDFAIIDTEHKGYVTEEQIREHRKEERAATRAKHAAAKAAAGKPQ